MPYYLSQLAPIGPRNGKAPVGSDSQAGGNWILVNDAGTKAKRALLYLPQPFSDNRVDLIADDLDSPLTTQARNFLANYLGDRSYPATTTLRQAVVDFMKAPPPDRWNPIQPGKTGKVPGFKIWLGPGVPQGAPMYAEYVAPGASTKLWGDTFDRANGNLAGTLSSDGNFTWADIEAGGDNWNILSNLASASANNLYRAATINANLDTVDHYAQAVLTACVYQVTDSNIGVFVRNEANDATGYSVEIGIKASANSRQIITLDDSVAIASDSVAAATDGLLRLEGDGSSITAKLNGATILGPVTDTQFSTGKRTGINAYSVVVGTTLQLDNFQTGDLGRDVGPFPVTKLRPRPFAPGIGR